LARRLTCEDPNECSKSIVHAPFAAATYAPGTSRLIGASPSAS
jgi:hypothetical protein